MTEPETIPRADVLCSTEQDISEADVVGTKITIDGDKYRVVCEPHVLDEDTVEILSVQGAGMEIEGKCHYCGQELYKYIHTDEFTVCD